MENHNLPDNLMLVRLSPADPKISEELKGLNENLSQNSECDVVLDFSNVEVINSSNISNLLILRALIEEHGRKLFLYNVRTITKCIFVVAGLSEFFVFADDMNDVLNAVQSGVCIKA